VSVRRRLTALNFFPAFLPPSSGGELRYYHVYKQLGRHYEIAMVSPTHPFVPPETVVIGDGVVEHRVPKSWRHVFLQRLFDRVAGFPECSAVVVSLAAYAERRYRAIVRELCARADIVVHEFPFLVPHARKREGQLLVYDAHNVEFDLQRGMLTGPLGRLLSRHVKRLEALICRDADVVFATSADDRRRLMELYRVPAEKIFVAPNGVDVAAVTAASDAEREEARRGLGLDGRPLLLFVGSLHPPNLEAVEALIAHLAPRLPDAVVVIAGSVTEAMGPGRVPPNVVCLGRFTQRAKALLLRAADVALNPMRSGSGTNLKMLEYLAAGLPVVTTPVGARGLDVVDGRHAIVAALDDFPAAIARVLTDGALRATLRAHGRRLAEERYDWSGIAEAMHDVIESALAELPGRPVRPTARVSS
jgi:glycosyltransferase involved in cell wall biosynthesis